MYSAAQPLKLVLASASPRRRALLRRLAPDFAVVPAGLPEDARGLSPGELVSTHARQKAQAVARAGHAGVVVGADTVVVLDGAALGKPRGRQEAADMLARLSGRVHTVLTGLCALNTLTGRRAEACQATRVHVRVLSPEEIARYLEREEYADKAGAYAIQGGAARFVEHLEGDYYNVMGLPLARLEALLHEVGFRADPAGAKR